MAQTGCRGYLIFSYAKPLGVRMNIVGFIGLGNMGHPMVKSLLDTGYAVKVYDLNLQAIATLVDEGATASASIAELAEGSDIVITMLQTGEQVRQCCLGSDGIFSHIDRKSIFIDCSSIDVETSRQLHEKAAEEKISMLDAPVSGGVLAAQNSALTFMVGGENDIFDSARPIFTSMGKVAILAGGPGCGAAAKICNNMLLGISMIGTCETLNLAQQLGLTAQKLFEISSNATGRCWSLVDYCPAPGVLSAVPSSNDYKPGFAAKMMLKDLKLSQKAAKLVGSNTPLGEHAEKLYAEFVDSGNADVDFSGIINMLKEQ
jgi:3-hydroxyisobutyrate dehydrogenase